jgi:hypothetical protein
MANYTITYTATEDLAMQYAAASVDDWVQNACHERARIAIEEIVQLAVQKFLEAGQSIPGSKDEIVAAAFDNGWIKTAAQRNEEALATIPVANT